MRGVQQMPGTILSNEADLQRQTMNPNFNVEENDGRVDMEDEDASQQLEPQIQETAEDLNQRA
jgi:hypothetical protein